MSKFKILALLSLFAIGCSGYDSAEDYDFGQAEQDISVRPYFGVDATVGFGTECVPTMDVQCIYPSSKVIGIRLETTGLASTEAALAQTVLTETISQVGSQLPAGWSVTQLFGAPASIADLIISFGNHGTWSGVTLKTWMLATPFCVSNGPTMSESPAIPGSHRFCHRYNGRVNIQQILFMSAAQRANLLEHAFGSLILQRAGRGTSEHTPNQSYYSAGNVLPIGKTGLAPWDVCFLSSYSTTNPTVINRSTLTCP
jgi:hypothetical protein